MDHAALRRGADAEVDHRPRQPQADLRGAHGRAVYDRDHRPDGQPAARPAGPDRGDPDASARAALTAQADHRRPFQHRTRARGAGRAASRPVGPAAMTAMSAEPSPRYVFRLYVTG